MKPIKCTLQAIPKEVLSLSSYMFNISWIMYLLKFVNCSVLSFILPFIIFIAKRSSKSYLSGTYQIIFLIFYGGMFSTGNYQIIFLIFYGGMYSTKAHRKELRYSIKRSHQPIIKTETAVNICRKQTQNLIRINFTRTNYKKNGILEWQRTAVCNWLTTPPFHDTKIGFVRDCRTYLKYIKIRKFIIYNWKKWDNKW